MKLGDLFYPGIRGSSLAYEELFYEYEAYDYVYNNDTKVAIYSSQAEVFGFLPKSKLKANSVYSTKDALIMCRVGNAGTLFVPSDETWSCTDNVIPLFPKSEFRGNLELKLIILSIQEEIYRRIITKSGYASATWNVIKEIEIEYNQREVEQYVKLENLARKCEKFISLIDNQLRKSVSTKGTKLKISDIFNVTSGVRITENQVYEHPGNMACVTSKTTKDGITWRADKEWLKGFRKNKKTVIVNTPCLTWAKDGNAGRLFYRDYEFYPNDHCGVLTPRKENVDLKWFMYTFQPFIYDHVTSKQGQGMLYEEQMANIEVVDPHDLELEKRIADEYEKLAELRNKLKSITNRLKSLLTVLVI